MESPYKSPARRRLPILPPAPKKNASYLSWWGIIPLIALFVVQAAYGWPAAKAATKMGAEPISYFVGRILGGLLIAVFVAWVVHRFFHGSRNASTIAFSIVIALACSAVLRESRSSQGSDSPRAPTVVLLKDFQFEIPTGWQLGRSEREKTQALLVQPAKDGPTGMMQVDAGTPALPDPKQMAQSFVGGDGRILPEPTFVDGIAGIRVETPSADLSRPRHIVVVSRNDQVYLIMAATTTDHDVSAAFDHVIKTWRGNRRPVILVFFLRCAGSRTLQSRGNRLGFSSI